VESGVLNPTDTAESLCTAEAILQRQSEENHATQAVNSAELSTRSALNWQTGLEMILKTKGLRVKTASKDWPEHIQS
jgi:hypothetical protein